MVRPMGWIRIVTVLMTKQKSTIARIRQITPARRFPVVATLGLDNDALPDWWEDLYFPGEGADNVFETDDDDFDGCDNLCEYQLGTNPSGADNNTCVTDVANNIASEIIGTYQTVFPDGQDTDCDGLLDGTELPDSSPSDPDTDGDGLTDGYESTWLARPTRVHRTVMTMN